MNYNNCKKNKALEITIMNFRSYNIECNMEWAKGWREKSEFGEQALKGGKVKRKRYVGFENM